MVSFPHKKHPDVAWRTIEGQAVLVHNRLGEVQVLNEVGTLIWERFEEGPERVAEEIASKYDVSVETAKADMDEFIQSLVDSGALIPPEP